MIVKRLCRLPVVMDPAQLLEVFQDYLACILAFSVAANQLRRLVKQLNCHPLIQMKVMMIVSYVEKPFLHTMQVDHLLSGLHAAAVTAGIMRLALLTQWMMHLCVTSVCRISL